MSLRENDDAATPADPPLTRREAREREARAAASKALVPFEPTSLEAAAFEAAPQSEDAKTTALAVPVAPAASEIAVPVPPATFRLDPPAVPRATSRPAPRMAQPQPAVAPRVTRPSRAAMISRKLLSVGAMAFAGALLVGLSVPANAFITNVDTFAPEEVVADKLPGQSIEVPAEAAAQVLSRDSYEVISWAEQLRIKYGNMSSSYSATTGAIRWPFPYSVTITDRFGERPAGTSGTSHHNGVDFTPGEGTPIYAIADGVVAKHDENTPSYGNAVYIQHDIGGQNIQSLYAHMLTGSSPLVPGTPIKVGDFIGLVGNTGASYGAHLHLEIQLDGIPIDPFAWLTANAVN